VSSITGQQTGLKSAFVKHWRFRQDSSCFDPAALLCLADPAAWLIPAPFFPAGVSSCIIFRLAPPFLGYNSGYLVFWQKGYIYINPFCPKTGNMVFIPYSFFQKSKKPKIQQS
jgi:hypothetical protein